MAKHSHPARGIYQRGETYWLTYQSGGKRTRISLETSDFAEAVKRAAELRAHPTLQPSEGIEADVTRFIAYKRERGDYTRDSAESKGYVLKKFARWLGEVTTASVSTKTIQSFYDETREQHSLSTANSYLMMIRAFFRWSCEIAKITRANPCASIKQIDAKSAARLDFCTRAQRDTLIEKCTREDLKFVLFCGFHAGMRFQEIVQAKAFWFDLNEKMIHLRKTETMQFKDGEERSVPMTSQFHAFLATYGLREPFMLRPDVTMGKSIYRYDFGRPFSGHVKACGLPWVTPHVMRHTFASLLASAGTSIYLISEWLGDDVRVVQRHYARLLPLHGEIEKAFTQVVPQPSTGRTPHPGLAGHTG